MSQHPIEVMKQALEALERYAPQHGHPDDMSDAITALRAAIEAAERQETKADGLIRGYINALVANRPDEAADATKRMVDYVFNTTPAAQRQWVGLTEKDFSAINQSCLTKLQAATSAESILKEKNHER